MRTLLNPPDDWIDSVVGSPAKFWSFFVFQCLGISALIYFTDTNGWSSLVLMALLICLLQLSVLAALRQVHRSHQRT
jgi:hypothetical protein